MLDPLGEEILGQHLLVGGEVRRLIGGQGLVWKQELILLLVTFMLHDMHNISSVNLREEKYVECRYTSRFFECGFIIIIIKGLKIKHPNNSN